MSERFWETVALQDMTEKQWESLCDSCGKCCLHKLQDEDSDELYYTKVVCRYMDQEACNCTEYSQRQILVPDCVKLSPDNLNDLDWMPNTCAYRLLNEGKPLPDWHHLVSGSKSTVHTAGVSVRGRCLSEEYVHPDGLEEHIVNWVE